MGMNNDSKVVYMKIIDGIVEDSNPVSSRLIKEQKIYSREKGKEKYNEIRNWIRY